MNKEPELMTDTELDALLAHASAPPLPLGAKQRLMAKLSHVEGAGAAHSTVVPLRRPEKVASRLGWLAGLPLAASLTAVVPDTGRCCVTTPRPSIDTMAPNARPADW